MTESVRRTRSPGLARWIPILILSALAWRLVRYVLVFPMWGDEGMLAVNFFDRSLLGLLEPLDYGQIAPSGFLWLELGTRRILGFTEPALRLVPFVAGIAAVIVFWLACRKLLDRRSAIVALAVFAASFYPVRYAAEVKPYSLDFLVALLLILAAWAIYQRPGSTRRWASFAVLAAVAVWLSYPAAFVAGGACLWLLAYGAGDGTSRTRARAIAIGAGAVLLASFVVMYALAGSAQRAGAPAAYWEAGFPPLAEPWRIPLWLLDVHTGMMLAYPNGGHSGGSAASFLLAVAGGIVLWRTRRPLLLLLLSPLPLMLVAASLRLYPYGASARVAQHVAPAACMLIGVGIVFVLRRVLGARRTVRALPLAVFPFFIVAAGGIVRDIVRPYHSRADVMARDIVQEVSGATASGDRWTVYASRERGTDVPHFRRFVGMGGRLHFQILSQATVPVLWGPDPYDLADTAGSAGTTWLIAYGNRVFEPERARLDAFVDRTAAAIGAEPTVSRHELPDREWVEIYRFERP